ncbi:hypothetical protein GCM10020358_12540 [Amorphoplanes nipponensis]|uniref:PQ loop repeat-containing protein n=1 Tax=Actinoplanes nipponensis TaxID=135950 RepID=A0A919JPR5_9ACTN|nr:SemiSWEET transporter [Actinoplanes nipponensis]GIE50709.1 hypothetical protein Ani05nite_42430 [Actinoplanes nipponensis]
MHSTALLGWFGAALSIVLPWPQVWRSVARGRTKGLSATACWQGVAMPVGWITYGLLTGELVQVVTNTVTGVAGLAVLVTVLVKQGELRTGRNLAMSAAGAAIVVSAAAASAVAGWLAGVGGARSAAFLGAVLACAAVLGAIPQPLSLLRDRRQDLAGLSPLRWWLAAAACACWCSYGLATGQLAVWSSALVGLSSALIVCWRLVADRRDRAAAAGRTVAPAVRVAHSPARVVRPAGAGGLLPVRGVASASARIVRPAPTAARPVAGPARVRSAPARPARGVARVPRAAPPATVVLARVLAPA